MTATAIYRLEYLTQWGWEPCRDFLPTEDLAEAQEEARIRLAYMAGRRTYRAAPAPTASK